MCQLIKYFEDCRLESYQDSSGIWTVGWGSTKGVKGGIKITQEEADRLLDLDLYDAEMRVKKAMPDLFYTLTENEKEAMISLAYNLRSFEQLAGHLPDKERFKRKMLLYAKDVSGNFLKGLKIRRICERLLFENKEWYSVAVELQDRNKTIEDVKQKERELWS